MHGQHWGVEGIYGSFELKLVMCFAYDIMLNHSQYSLAIARKGYNLQQQLQTLSLLSKY